MRFQPISWAHVKYQLASKTIYEAPNSENHYCGGLDSNCGPNRTSNHHLVSKPVNDALDCIWRLEPSGYSTCGEFDSPYHCSIDSNGRTNFFTRWWNQPELEHKGDFLYRTINVNFETSDGRPKTKEVHLIEISVRNTGNEDAFEPEIHAVHCCKTQKSGKEISHSMLTFRNSGVLLSYLNLKTRSQEPDETELATLFVKNGLQPTPFIAGGTSQFIVFGFTFKDGSFFHFASTDVFAFASFPLGVGQPDLVFELGAKARNSGKALLCKRVTLAMSSPPEELRLIRS